MLVIDDKRHERNEAKAYLQSIGNGQANDTSAYSVTTKNGKESSCEDNQTAEYFQSETKPPERETEPLIQ
jgi:hypothetical protein